MAFTEQDRRRRGLSVSRGTVEDLVARLGVTATGTTGARSAADRAAERVSVLDFGADSSNYTVKAQAAAAWMRGRALAPASGSVFGANGTHLHLGTGRQTLEASLNFQQMNDWGWIIDGSGCVIQCATATKTAFDLLGCRAGKVIVNLQGTAAIGLQVGRMDDASGEDYYPAESLSLDVRADGMFSRSVVYNLSSETMHLQTPFMLNGDATGGASS
jgi:hypothetical protein